MANERVLRLKFDGSVKGLAKAANDVKGLINDVDRAEAMAAAEQAKRDAAAQRRQEQIDREQAKAHDDYIRRIQVEEDALMKQGRIEEAAYKEDLRRTATKQRELDLAAKARVKAEQDAQREIERLRKAAADSDRDRVKVEEDTADRRSRIFTRLRGDLAGFAKVFGGTLAKLSIGSSGLLGLTQTLAAVVSWAGQASGVLGLIPGALLAGAAAMVTLKLGADGLKNAFKPTVDVIDKLKASVSATFQKELAGPVKDLNKLLPQTTSHFKGIASAISSVVGKFVNMLKSGGNMGVVNGILDKTSVLIRRLGEFLAPVAQAFLDLADVGLGVLTDMSTGIGDVGKRFADWMRGMKDSGELREWITKGLGAFRDLFGLIKEGATIVFDVFNAVKEGAGTAAPVLKPLMDMFKEFVESDQGQETFKELGKVLRQLGDAASKVLGPALKAIAPLITPLADAFGTIATKIADVLGPAIDDLGPSLKPVVEAAAKFADAFVTSLLPALPGLVDLLRVAGSALVLLTPVFISLAVATNFWVSVLIAAGQALVGNFSGAADTMKNAWNTSMDSMKVVTGTNWMQMSTDVLNGTTTTTDAVKGSAVEQRERWGQGVGGMATDTATAWGSMGDAVSGSLGKMRSDSDSIGTTIRGNISNHMVGAVSDVAAAGGTMRGSWGNAVNGMKDGTRAGIGDVKDQTGSLPGWIQGKFDGVSLFGAGRSIMGSLGDGLKAAWGGIKSLLNSISVQIPQQKGPPEKDRKMLRPAGRLIMQGLGNGLSDGWGGVKTWLGGVSAQMPGLIPAVPNSALSNLLPDATAAAGSTAAAAPDVYVTVMLDGKPVQALVKAEVAGNNVNVRRLAGSGSGAPQ